MGTVRPKAKGFRDLEVWRLGMKIGTDVYEATRTFPKEELYGLVSQMRRAAVPDALLVERLVPSPVHARCGFQALQTSTKA